MATTTTNYGFKKPAQTDNYNVDDFNFNADIADAQIKAVNTRVDNWYTFRNNGGTLFSSLIFENTNTTKDTIKTLKNNLDIIAKDMSITFDSLNKKILPKNNNEISIGDSATALKSIYTGDYSKAVNGSNTLTNGFEERFGEVQVKLTLGSSLTKQVSFETPFTNDCIIVYATCHYDVTGNSTAACASIIANANVNIVNGKTIFTLMCGAIQLGGTGWASGERTFQIRYRALGY